MRFCFIFNKILECLLQCDGENLHINGNYDRLQITRLTMRKSTIFKLNGNPLYFFKLSHVQAVGLQDFPCFNLIRSTFFGVLSYLTGFHYNKLSSYFIQRKGIFLTIGALDINEVLSVE